MTEPQQLALFVGLAIAAAALGVWFLMRFLSRSPEKRERKRRLEVHKRGRLGDAFITEANDASIFYEYSIHGVQYAASQDVTALRHLLPEDPQRLIGIAHLKYLVNNPANSILVCEDWSGLRMPTRVSS